MLRVAHGSQEIWFEDIQEVLSHAPGEWSQNVEHVGELAIFTVRCDMHGYIGRNFYIMNGKQLSLSNFLIYHSVIFL